MVRNRRCAFLFPGQGAQYVGMGKDFYDLFTVAKETFDEADELLSFPLSRLVFEGPSAELTLTKYSQLAIFVTSIALLRVLHQQIPNLVPEVCAGLSLGEYTALTASGKLLFFDCLSLVRDRAAFMHEACSSTEGTMRVVLGLEAGEVEKTISELQGALQVWVANLNCPGQVVIAGTVSGIEAASEVLKSRGAKRILPLDVSGAFHSGLMKEAQLRLAPKIQQMNFQDTQIDLVMNVPGDYVVSLSDIREHLVFQVTDTVRWERGMFAMVQRGIEVFLEIGCGKTLSGMARKIGIPAASILSLEKVSDLDELSSL